MKALLGAAVLIGGLGLCGWLYTAWQAGVIERRFPPQGSFVALADGARLHFTERRPGTAPRATVVLVHGASGNQADLMVPLGDRLAARGFRVLAFDRPGHGWSDRPDGQDGDASPARQADLILDGLRRIGVTHAILLGHSWSGALVAAAALDHPDAVDGIVLVSPVLYPWPGGIAWYYGPTTSRWLGPVFTHVVTLPVGQLLLPAGIAEVFAPQPPPPDFAARTGVELVLRPDQFGDNAADVFHLHDFVTGLAPRLPELAVPVAIVAGDGDRVASAAFHAERALREVPGATLALLPGRGHSPQWSDPEIVVAAVGSVADRLAARAPAAAAGVTPP